MASTQTSYLNSAVGTSPATILTASATTALVGCQVANISGAAITVDVYITRSATNFYLIKGATIPVGGALALIGGDVKHFLLNGDALKCVSSAASSADFVTSAAVGV
jgi:hypothetical protein